MDVEVDRALGLVVGAGPVEDGDVALPVDRQRHLERAVAEAVVVDIVGEGDRLDGDIFVDQDLHRLAGAVEQHVAGGDIGVAAEAVAEFAHAGRGRPAAGDQRHQVGAVHVRRARVVEHDVEHALVEHALLIDAHRRDPEAFLPDRPRVERHRARHLAADIDHVAEDRREAHQDALVEDRHHHAPVVVVRDGALAGIGIVPDEDVALVEVALELLNDCRDVGAELADDHAAAGVADHRELVVLLADDRRERDADHDAVHLGARVLQRVLDDVQGDRIDLDGAMSGGRSVHGVSSPSRRARSGDCRARRPRHSGAARARWWYRIGG